MNALPKKMMSSFLSLTTNNWKNGAGTVLYVLVLLQCALSKDNCIARPGASFWN
jgi:hypothetical protein